MIFRISGLEINRIYIIFTNLFCLIASGFLVATAGNSEALVLFSLGRWYQMPLANNGKLCPLLK